MIQLCRISSFNVRRPPPVVLGFAAGLAGGLAIGLAAKGVPVASASVPAAEALRSPAPPVSLMRARLIPADVLRVLDGDTFEARVHVWPGLDVTTKVRLRGIDAAELRARCPQERVKAEAARDALREMLEQGAVAVYGVSLDKYGGRVVADATTRSIPSVSAELLARGQARPYAGGHRDGWCDGTP
jgi:endonuclease YncB( thermonuclease family)